MYNRPPVKTLLCVHLWLIRQNHTMAAFHVYRKQTALLTEKRSGVKVCLLTNENDIAT